MKKSTSLRSPFVMTLAATTMFGCGATVTPAPTPPPDGSVTVDGPVVTDRPTPTDQPTVVETDVRRACPATLPTDGAACTPGIDPETCTDGAMTPAGCPPGTGVTARCDPTTQRWQLLAISCNPPPPMCPTAMPAPESPCTLPPVLTCEWGRCADRSVARGTCVDSRWSLQIAECVTDAGAAPTDL